MLEQFLDLLNNTPEQVTFEQTQQVIAEHYTYRKVAFDNNGLQSSEQQNQGSCKIFAFAQLHRLTKAQTLHCFGAYYRIDVLTNPNNDDHSNIRQLMQETSDLNNVKFASPPLVPTSNES